MTPPPARGTDLAPQEVFAAVWQKKWTGICALLVCVGAAVAYLKTATPVYTATARLYVTPDLPPTAGALGMERSKNYLNTQCELLKSTPILGRVAGLPEPLGEAAPAAPGTIIKSLKEQLVVELGNKDDLIELSLDSVDPHEAARIVNAVVESYVAYQTAQKRSSTTEMLKILRKEKEAWEQELTHKREAVLKFKRENAVLSLQTDRNAGSTILQRLAHLSDAKTKAQLEAMETAAAYETVRAALQDPARRVDVVAAIVTDAAETATERGRSALQNQLHEAQLRLALMKSRHLGDRNPLVVSLVGHIAETEKRLADLDLELVTAHVTSIEQSWRAAQQRLASIDESLEEQRNEALELNATSAKLAVLESGVEQAQKLVEGIESRIKELGLDGETGGLNVEVLEWAQAEPEPSKPRKGLVLIAASLLGLIVGSSLAFVRASTDRRVRSAEQIEDALGVPVLAAIPRIKRRRKLAEKMTRRAPLDPGWEAADAYRTIRTAIYFGSREQAIKTLVVTSGIKGEGKSTVASNLAAAMAHAGERTLLIDADLRRPSLHKTLKVGNETGLSTILTGKCEVRAAMSPTCINRLDLLPAGPIPSNPTELLSSPQFGDLLSQLSHEYERIVLDAPPVLGMADAMILGARCDATLLVVRADLADLRATEAAFAALVNIGARSIATVINGLRRPHAYLRYTTGYGWEERLASPAAVPQADGERVPAMPVEIVVGSEIDSGGDASGSGRTTAPGQLLSVQIVARDAETQQGNRGPTQSAGNGDIAAIGATASPVGSPFTHTNAPKQDDEHLHTNARDGGGNGANVARPRQGR